MYHSFILWVALAVLHRLKTQRISIVAVHGLDGHWRRSWTADNGVFWLQDLLPSKLPNARIYSYSHDSRTRGSDVPLTLDISDHGSALVSDLTVERILTAVSHIQSLRIIFRPFICLEPEAELINIDRTTTHHLFCA